jgi:hypothetical protein
MTKDDRFRKFNLILISSCMQFWSEGPDATWNSGLPTRLYLSPSTVNPPPSTLPNAKPKIQEALSLRYQQYKFQPYFDYF